MVGQSWREPTYPHLGRIGRRFTSTGGRGEQDRPSESRDGFVHSATPLARDQRNLSTLQTVQRLGRIHDPRFQGVGVKWAARRWALGVPENLLAGFSVV